MDNTGGLQFFVLDISVIILGVVTVLLAVAVAGIYRRYREQKKMYQSLEKTVDRILKIEESGGIDGWAMEMQEKKSAKNRKKEK